MSASASASFLYPYRCKSFPYEVVHDDPDRPKPVARVGTKLQRVHGLADRKRPGAPSSAEAVVREIVCANQFLRALLRRDAAPERQEAGEHLDPHRKAPPRHVHSSRHGWDELSPPIDTLNIDGVVVTISGIPAKLLDPLRQLFRLASKADHDPPSVRAAAPVLPTLRRS